MKIAVIGAGMGGLAAAIELAARGREVIVYELADRPGGKVGVAEHQGVEFDTGPSVMTMLPVLEKLFRRAGSSLERELQFVEPNPWFRYLFPGGTALDVFHDSERTIASVESTLGADAGREFADFLGYAQRIWEAAAPNFVFSQAPSVGRMMRLGLTAPREVVDIDPLRTMWSAIRSRVSAPHLRWLFARYATYVGGDPREAPATLNCISWVELGGRSCGIEGGMYELVRTLERVARGLGVEFRYGSRVDRLVERGGAIGEVVAVDGRESVDATVVNADVGHLVEELAEEAGLDALESSQPRSMSGWTAVVKAARRSSTERPPHTVLFPEDYLREFDDIFEQGRPPEMPTVYLCAQEKAHRREGWSDGEPLFVMVNAPPVSEGGRDGEGRWEELSRKVMHRLEMAGLVEGDDEVVWRRNPHDLAARFPGSRGAIYGAASNSRFAAFHRPPNRVERIDGLYLASGSAHPGGGVPMSLQSGRLAAQAFVEDE